MTTRFLSHTFAFLPNFSWKMPMVVLAAGSPCFRRCLACRVCTLPVACVVMGLTLGFGYLAVTRAADAERTRLRKMLEGISPTHADELEILGQARVNCDTPSD